MTDQQNPELTSCLPGNEPSINSESEQALLADIKALLSTTPSGVTNFPEFAHGVFMGLLHVPGLSSELITELRKAVEEACEANERNTHPNG